MSKYLDLFQSHDKVIESYEVVGEWEIWTRHNHIGPQSISFKVKLGKDARYHFEASHFYHGSKQAGPYVTSKTSGATVEEVIQHALTQTFMFFEEDDQGARWVKNEHY